MLYFYPYYVLKLKKQVGEYDVIQKTIDSILRQNREP